VIIVFYAARLQKQELDATREELKKQAESTRELSESSQKQNLNLILQRFENTFFNLVNIHQENVSLFRTDANGQAFGKGAFPYALGQIESKLADQFGHPRMFAPGAVSHEIFSTAYNKVGSIGSIDNSSHYYKHIINLLLFIRDSAISVERKSFYVKVFVSMFSPDELTLIFYYICLKDRIKNRKEIISFAKEMNLFEDLTVKQSTHLLLLEYEY